MKNYLRLLLGAKFYITGIVLALVIYAVGIWLQGLYGLDPPYIYLYAGVIFQLIVAPGILVILIFSLIWKFMIKRFFK